MPRKVFFLLCLIVLCSNVISGISENLLAIRIVRFLSISIYFLLFLKYRTQKCKWLLAALILIVTSDFFMLFFEISFNAAIVSVTKGTAYLCLIMYIKNRIDFKKINTRIYYVLAPLILINFYSLYKIICYIQTGPTYYFPTLVIVFHGLSLIFSCFFAGINNFLKNTRASLYFSILVFSFALSDLIVIPAYFMEFKSFYLWERIFYVIALIFIMEHATITTKNYSLNL